MLPRQQWCWNGLTLSPLGKVSRGSRDMRTEPSDCNMHEGKMYSAWSEVFISLYGIVTN